MSSAIRSAMLGLAFCTALPAALAQGAGPAGGMGPGMGPGMGMGPSAGASGPSVMQMGPGGRQHGHYAGMDMLTPAPTATSTAASQDGAPPVRRAGDIDYQTGGGGVDEMAAMRRTASEFNLRLTFAGQAGESLVTRASSALRGRKSSPRYRTGLLCM